MLWFLLFASAALSSAIATVPAQELPRGRALGEVRDLDGKPWVGATVQLWSVTSPMDPTYEVDRVVTRTDARGRFRAPVLTGRTYHAWATMSGDGARFRASRIRDLQAKGPVVLRETKGDFHRRIIRVKNPRALKSVAPLRMVLRLVWPARIHFELERTAVGWRLPELPVGGSARLTVYGSHGSSVDVGDREMIDWVGAQPMEITLSVRRLEIIAVTEPRGELVAGAGVFCESATRPYRVGTTDASGHAVLQMLQHGNHFPYARLFVQKAGWAAARLKRDEGREEFFAVMIRESANVATVRLDLRRPAQGMLIEAPFPDSFWGDGSAPQVASHRTDSKGRFRFETNDPRDGMLVAALRREHIAALPEAWRRDLSPRAVLGRSRRAGLGLEFVLEYTPPVDIRIKAPDGAPAPGAEVVFHTSEQNPLTLRADRLGRLRVILPNRVPICVGVRHESGFRFRSLYRVARGQDPQTCEIRLSRPLTLRGHVVDQNGHGVAGAFAMMYSVEAPDGSNPPARFDTDPGVQVVRPVSNPALVRLARMFGPHRKTGSDGEFSMQLPAGELRYKLLARYFTKNPSRAYVTRVPVPVVRTGDQLAPIELTLNGVFNTKK